jgi:hypothetical protein
MNSAAFDWPVPVRATRRQRTVHRDAGLRLVKQQDVTDNAAEVSGRWHQRGSTSARP